MVSLDTERERHSLAARYAGMSDAELQELAGDAASLSEIAAQALSEEVRRRGLNVEPAELALPPKDIEGCEPVVVAQFLGMPQAYPAKGAVDATGIECYLVDDNMVRLIWFLSNALGGIKLATRLEDAEAAVEILEQPIPEYFEVEGVGGYQQPRCPRCGSINVRGEGREGRFDRRFDVWKCEACGTQWDEEDDEGEAEEKPDSKDPQL